MWIDIVHLPSLPPSPPRIYRSSLVESLTISTGSRNPGAAALQFNANNEGGVFNVTLISEDSTAAVGLDLGFCSEIGPTMI